MPDRQPVYLPRFRRDLLEVADWSGKHYGEAATDRYFALISHALRDIQQNVFLTGAQPRPELGHNLFSYHLRYSRGRVRGERVKTPRHFLLYRVVSDSVEFARLLHDSRELKQNLML